MKYQPPPRCFPPASHAEVMAEQLAYLLYHKSDGVECPENCSDCLRLGQVESWLLLPFRNRKSFFRSKVRAAA